MRMLDKDLDKPVDRLVLLMKTDEAKQLYSYLADLLHDPIDSHFHVETDDMQIEITVCIYDEHNLAQYNDRTKKLILENR